MEVEAFNKEEFITVGKYRISKFILMSDPCQFQVTNSETNKTKNYYLNILYQLLRSEGLDTDPLDEFFDNMSGIYSTKEERIETRKKLQKEYDELLAKEEKKLMKLEDTRQDK